MEKLDRQNTGLLADKPLKVLQFGGGNFLRAFADWMIDELNLKTDFNAGVLIVKPTERGAYQALRNQDGLFNVLTNGIMNGEEVTQKQLISCVQKIINPYHEWDSYLKTAECATIRFIISNTTESGIQFSSSDQFSDNAKVEFPAKVTRWLLHRWTFFKGSAESACVFLPCELIEQNGQTLKDCILKYADLWSLESEFTSWINEHNHFCNSLVDRIVPGYPNVGAKEILESLGFQDNLMVSAEPYHLWVIQAPQHIQAELPFDQTNLNVVFTDDLGPYRKLKVRILNGAHTLMVPVAYLAGIETVREAVEDHKIGAIIKEAILKEVLPTLDFPQNQLEKYVDDVWDRFKNPFVEHRLINISLNSISKFKTRVLPSLLEYIILKEQIPQRMITSFAALICFYRGKRGDENIPLKDGESVLSFFKNAWEAWDSTRNTSELVRTVLANQDLWGQDLNEIVGLDLALESALAKRLT